MEIAGGVEAALCWLTLEERGATAPLCGQKVIAIMEADTRGKMARAANP